MKTSDRGIMLVKEFEGFRGTAYKDMGGLPTVGYGHVIRQGEHFDHMTEAEATVLLCRDLEIAEACVEEAVDATLLQHQFDALCAFVFNIGCYNFKHSTMLRRLNRLDYVGASDEFPRWSLVDGKRINGLLRRREAERALFLTGALV